MMLRHSSAVLLLLLGCSGQSTKQTELARSCADAAQTALAPRRDAGLPVCIGVGDAGCPSPPPMDGRPDPANWACEADKDCAVFPDLPFCDGRHCSAAQATVTCVANAASVEGLPSPEIARTFTGSNGTFANRCDEHGNLIAYQCEMTLPPCDPTASSVPNACSFRSLVFTGKVVPFQDSPTIDCEGQCRGGRCDGRCPQQGDEITLIGLDATGSVVIHNDTDGRTYSCMSDPAYNYAINFDCARSPGGQSGYVSGLGLASADGFCTGKNWGGIAVVVDGVQTTPQGLGETCSYLSCRIVPDTRCTL